MKIRFFALATLLAGAPAYAATINVNIASFAFSPSAVTINPGDTVKWTNLDAFPHTSTSVTSVWNSGALSQNQSFSFTFGSQGVFNYQCNIHTHMKGVVTVVPEPGSVVALAAGLVLLVRRRRQSASRTKPRA